MTNQHNYYDELSSGYDTLYSDEQKIKFLTIKKYINTNKFDKVLDIGGGTGILCDFFNAKITNLEPSKEMLKQGLAKNRDFLPVNDIAENINSLFKSNEFDKVFCITSAHHFKDLNAVLLSISKVSKNNADIMISLLKRAPSTPNLIKKAKTFFQIENQIEDEKDIILFFKNKK